MSLTEYLHHHDEEEAEQEASHLQEAGQCAEPLPGQEAVQETSPCQALQHCHRHLVQSHLRLRDDDAQPRPWTQY